MSLISSSGTITVSTNASDESGEGSRTCWGMKRPVILQRRVQLKQQPVHLYVSRDGGLLSQFSNVAGFCLKYNEEHLLMTDTLPSFHHAVVEDDAPLKVDTDQQPVQLAFLVRVISRRTVVTVGPDTSLSLLLNMACLHVVQLILNGTQMLQLLTPRQLKK
jgi:hypothetical protein